jgi:hypothetical protein
MNTATESSSSVDQAKLNTEMCMGRLLKTLSFVPDDKLDWSPAQGCKSPLRIAAHCGVSNGNFIKIMKRIPFPEMKPEEMMAMAEAAETAVTSREQAVSLVEESCKRVFETLDSRSPEEVDSLVETRFFTAPMVFWMNLPARHMDNHAAQIDLLQTCWGDYDWHM